MTESTTITVERHRDPDGAPTCCRVFGKQQCRFMSSRKFGCISVCSLTGDDLHSGPHNMQPGDIVIVSAQGWLRPATGCPVWPDDVTA